MRSFLNYFILIPFLLSLGGCQKTAVMNENQKILFQYSYLNSAAGNINQGFIIDNEGNLLIYNQPEKWNLPDKNSVISQAQVLENLSMCTLTGKKVPEAELLKHTKNIINIASSRVTARKTIAPRSASYGYYCYVYNGGNSTYRQVTVKTAGAFESENLNFYSRRIVEWMNQMLQGLPLQHP